MNRLDEQTRVWWRGVKFVAIMAFTFGTTTSLSPTTSVAFGSEYKDAVERAGERYSESVITADPLDVFKGKEQLTKEELKELLALVGFEGKSLKIAWAVAMKESTGRPVAHNGNRNTGDNSYGLFQINMIDELGEARREQFGLKSNEELLDPVRNAEIAFYMTGKGQNWSSWKVDASQKDGGNSAFAKWLSQYPAN